VVSKFQRVLVFLPFLFGLLFPNLAFANNANTNNSILTISTSSVPADGSTTATITITVKDNSGSLLSAGDHITLISTADSGLSINGSGRGTTNWTAATDSNGNAVFAVNSNNPGTDTFTFSDVSDNPAVSLGSSTNNNLTVTFTVPSSTSNSSCSDAVPGSTPNLTSAASNSSNQITLTWTDAADPVSYYLIAYGTTSGQYIYGNPNIGNQGTTSYTVGSLVKGTTYYFVIKAVNGCNSGSWSNEASAIAGGLPTPTLTQENTSDSTSNSNSDNSQQNVDNSMVQDTPTDTPVPQPTDTPTPAPVNNAGTTKIIVYGLFIIIVGSVGVIYWRKFKNGKKKTDLNSY
jgi:hypothetical protein